MICRNSGTAAVIEAERLMKPDPRRQEKPAIARGLEDRKPAVDGAAIARLREIADGDLEFLKEVIIAYQTDTAKRLVDLRNALATGDAKGVRRTAHTIHGSSLNVGTENLAVYCRQLEQIAASGKLDGAAGLAARIEQESKRVEAELSGFIQG
jgi:HPt (histidine-containing phosphotransfer) domain-containing protein